MNPPPVSRPAPLPPTVLLVRVATLAGCLIAAPAQATIFGSLGNFDVINDTGKPAYGFEIDIEDPSYDHSKIFSVFGLNRVFSFVSPDPGAVVRYGKPVIVDDPGVGVHILYGSGAGSAVGGISTPSAPFATTGESCWPGANPSWQSTSCDHFGVSTYGNPARTTYSWLVDNGAGSLVKQSAAIPSVSFNFTPPPPPPPPPPPGVPPAPPPVPAVVNAVIQAPAVQAPAPEANAYWVKITTTQLPENADLGDLLGGNHPGALPQIAALKDAPEVEIEWQPLQIGKVDEVSKVVNPNGNPSIVVAYQFFKYQGQFDGEGLVDPISAQFPHMDGQSAFVTLADGRHDLVYVGQQIAAFNANQPLAAAVPEPQGYALMAGGLAMLGLLARRRDHSKR